MKRRPPQTLLLLAARRSLVPLVCAAFAAAVLGLLAPVEAAGSGPTTTKSAATYVTDAAGSAPDAGLASDASPDPSTGSTSAATSSASGTATSSVPPSQPDSLPPTEVKRQRPLTPLLTLAAIEEAWNAGRADSIVALFPEEKIVLRLEANVPEETSFSRQQAAYMLKDAFRYTVTESFQFLDFTYDKDEGAGPSGNAEWSYRREPQAEKTTNKVHVTLRKEKGRWLISELRILD
ncbi:MAG: DUF4783 domain-containing protein [Candidatus Eiseniibacteriota bacterium]|nr:MAG: DUF4783 domain-containing protein [Candidatus Eisenbacteria bacterium]